MVKEADKIVLPNIEMYGGDTTPWQYDLYHNDGRRYTRSEATGYTAKLYIIPYAYKAGFAMTGSPVLTKTATISEKDGGAAATFEFGPSETLTMAGKYIYQVEFTGGSERRVGQGDLYIHPNIHQE